MALSQTMYLLKGVVQHYSWGGYNFIPALLEIENNEQKPYAEYWLGAHPNHSSILSGIDKPLNEFINNHSSILGEAVIKKFSSLPYLFKVLDVRQMLSIQVHPSKESAVENFKKENRKGIPVNAPNRNYKDENHKPELMVALNDFWLLHGFKDEINLGIIFDATPELEPLKKIFEEKGYRALYEEVMMMEQERVDEILQPLMQRIIPLYENGDLGKNEEDFWAARAASICCKDNHYDRGIFSIYFFNLLQLKKGEGIFQPSGMPHAYLEGMNVEVMANSDNVLRAGLTNKYVDVTELMKHVKFEPTNPGILSPAEKKEHVIFKSPAEEFELHLYRLAEGDDKNIVTNSAEIFFLFTGSAEFICGDEKIILQKGQSLFIVAESSVNIKTLSTINLFRVTVPAGAKN